MATSTREWQLDTVILLERVELPGADIAFKTEFTKARERTPDNRTDFDEATITLADESGVPSAAPMSALPSRPSRKRQTAFSNCWPRRLLSTVRSCRRIDTSRLTLEACGLTPGGAIARPAALVKAPPIQSKKPLPIARRFGEPRTTCSQRGGWGRGASGCGSRDAGTAPLGQSMSRTCPDHCPGHGTGQQPTPLWGGCPVPLSHGGLGSSIMASRKRIKVVRGFRGTRHHGLAPGRKAKPIIKESCSPALGHGPGRVPRGEVAAASQ